jgi:hypothetical protein
MAVEGRQPGDPYGGGSGNVIAAPTRGAPPVAKAPDSDARATKAGSKLVRWAAIEAVSGRRGTTKLRQDFHAIAERRGKFKARAAVARKLLTLVYYGLRDGEIRCLAEQEVARVLGPPAGCGS